MNKENLILCCYGRAGFEALNLILIRNNYGFENIIVFTHKENNETLINFLEGMKITFYTESINKCKNVVENKNCFLLSIHYRFIIKKEILESFTGRSVNLHPSLLPKYKGCFSSVWAIINEEQETGITYHECVPEVDGGNILIQEKIKISNHDTGFSLFHKLITLGIDNLDKLFELLDSNYEGIPQQGESTYYPREVPFNNKLERTWTDDKKNRYLRALHFPPFPPPIIS